MDIDDALIVLCPDGPQTRLTLKPFHNVFGLRFERLVDGIERSSGSPSFTLPSLHLRFDGGDTSGEVSGMNRRQAV